MFLQLIIDIFPHIERRVLPSWVKQNEENRVNRVKIKENENSKLFLIHI